MLLLEEAFELSGRMGGIKTEMRELKSLGSMTYQVQMLVLFLRDTDSKHAFPSLPVTHTSTHLVTKYCQHIQ